MGKNENDANGSPEIQQFGMLLVDRRHTVQIDFLYFEDCPSHEDALIRLYGVLAELNITATIQKIKVETEAEAQRWAFVGSPTIRVNGKDIVPPADDTYGLTCRVYRHEDGRFSPLPSVHMMREGIRANSQPTDSSNQQKEV